MRSRLLIVAMLCAAAVAAGCGSSGSSSKTSTTTARENQHVFEAEHFADGAIVGDVKTERCTLSGGTVTTCARVTVAGYPDSYQVGPFCPETITTPADRAGIWIDGNGVYDLSGSFIANLATFYDDSAWHMYDSDGKVKVTDTQAAFDGAARPNVDPAYQNHCVEGRLEWLADGKPVQTTILIPTTPVKAQTTSTHVGNNGITLDGIVIADAAPVSAILGAHTIAAFDDCGGHYNPAAGYHLHGAMGCGHLVEKNVVGETAMFGYAADGYPVHLPYAEKELAAADLDACNGHTTAAEGYHYHANDAAKNAVLPCLTGEYVSTGQAGGPGGGPPQGPPPGGGAPGNAGPTTAATSTATLTRAAEKLGVTLHALEDALGESPQGDLTTAAGLLGVRTAALRAALA